MKNIAFACNCAAGLLGSDPWTWVFAKNPACHAVRRITRQAHPHPNPLPEGEGVFKGAQA